MSEVFYLKRVGTFRFLLKSDKNNTLYMKTHIRCLWPWLVLIFGRDFVLCEVRAEVEQTFFISICDAGSEIEESVERPAMSMFALQQQDIDIY